MTGYNCGNCAHCARYGDNAVGDPFFFIEEPMASMLRERCGVCEIDHDETVVTMLSAEGDDAPCAGDYWEPRRVMGGEPVLEDYR